jgi:hypothetical protein
MMVFPLSLWDLSMWLAVMAIILLATAEILHASHEYSSRVMIDKQLLRFIAIGCGIAFGVMVVMHVAQMF